VSDFSSAPIPSGDFNEISAAASLLQKNFFNTWLTCNLEKTKQHLLRVRGLFRRVRKIAKSGY
jgi:hypothetical protein